MGCKGMEAKEVEPSKAEETVVLLVVVVAAESKKEVESGVDVLAETEAPEIERKMLVAPAADSSEQIFEDDEWAESGLTYTKEWPMVSSYGSDIRMS